MFCVSIHTTSPPQTPQLQNLVLLPLMTSTGTGPDTTLEQLTEGRIPYLAQESLPNYLRTKLDLEIEKKEHHVSTEVGVMKLPRTEI